MYPLSGGQVFQTNSFVIPWIGPEWNFGESHISSCNG